MEHGKADYYKPIRAGNFWNNSYIEYDSNGDRNKTLPVGEYLNNITLHLNDIRNDLITSYAWKIQLIIAITWCLLKIIMKSV